MLVLRLYQLVHKRYLTVPKHHMSCCHYAGHQQSSPHAPHLLPTHGERRLFTTSAHHQHPPPAPSTAWNAVSFSYLLTINTPTHPLQHGSQCRPATCPPSTPHATLIQQLFSTTTPQHGTQNSPTICLPPTSHASIQHSHTHHSTHLFVLQE